MATGKYLFRYEKKFLKKEGKKNQKKKLNLSMTKWHNFYNNSKLVFTY